jgi:hypothetical protein
MIKEQDFVTRKIKRMKLNQIYNFVCMCYGHFPAKNESKSTIATQKSEKVSKVPV